ncbi:MAG: ATP-binding cassette domain-containing protein [Planctomycetota bacterium]
MADRGPARPWLAPEVVQASPMDCGPAALYALLTGCGITVSYSRLREACQTDVDGTSINALERVAVVLGLDAVQILAPVDHVAHPAASTLPAIAVTRLPNGSVHFVLLWRRVGSFVQVMDPASGRRWRHVDDLRRELYVHALDLPAESWRRFAGTPTFVAVLEGELKALGHRAASARVAEALADPSWRTLAALEASMRMVRSLVVARSLARGSAAASLLDALFQSSRSADAIVGATVPAVYWSVRPHALGTDGAQVVNARGALLVRALRLRDTSQQPRNAARRLPRELAAALSEPPVRAARELWAQLTRADLRTAALLFGIAILSTGAVLAQAIAFRALFGLGAHLSASEQRLAAGAALIALMLIALLFDWPMTAGVLSLGRRLETRIRIAFQERLPRLSERWWGSRPTSDMAERAHSLLIVRQVPGLAARSVRGVATLAATAAGLIWLDPGSAPLVGLGAAVAIALPLVFGRALTERELLVRSHHGALSRFYLEALTGLVAVRVHGAETALRREHEAMLVEWVRAGYKLARGTLAMRVVTSACGAAVAILLFFEHLSRAGATPSALLFGYWALSLPVLGEQLATVVQQAPAMRNALLRALEPLGATADDTRSAVAEESEPAALAVDAPALKAAGALSAPSRERDVPALAPRTHGIAIRLREVSVTLGGTSVLSEIGLDIESGAHVALVGASGAGKSTLISVLLGLHRASSGHVRLDDEPLSKSSLERVRRATAWVDPAAQIWNDTLFQNLVYGPGTADADDLARALADARLGDLLESLPSGLATSLGEGGGFLSGGEGQRVRLGRALLRPDVRLALLDEPFRGLDRGTRRALLARARERWRGATLVCATHDVEETRAFDRVVVLDRGRILEDGSPRDLAADPTSRYSKLLAAERDLLERLWAAPGWTRWRVEGGAVAVEAARQSPRAVEDEA